MLTAPPRERPLWSWLLVAVWSAIIFLTIPFARAAQRQVASSSFGSEAFQYAVIAVLSIGALLALRAIRRAQWSGPRTRYLWLGIVTLVFIRYTLELKSSPEEAVHFVEYGLLAILIYRALTHSITDPTIYLTATAIGAGIGILDEVIQWMTPERYWDLRDIWLNFFGVALTEVGIALGLRPPLIKRPITAKGLRWLARACSVALLLLASNLVNTPDRIRWYAQRVPSLAFVDSQNDQMVEYGHRFSDPDIGLFRSRFTAQELAAVDLERSEEASAILDRYPTGELYVDFLAAYPASADPFVHEARVHIFRRDHYARISGEETDPEAARNDAGIAIRENQILEKYFAKTLARSTLVWTATKTASVSSHALLDQSYESPVSMHLFTRFEEGTLLAAILIALLALAALHRYASRPSAPA